MAKATGKKISGIYIPVQLDTSQYVDDLKSLRNEMASTISTVQTSFNKSLDTTKLSNNLVNLQKSFGQIRDSAKALDTIKLGGLDTALNQLNPQLTKIAQSLGVSAEAQKKFLAAAANTQAINQQVNALNQLKTITGLTTKEFEKLVKASNLPVSSEAIKQLTAQQSTNRNLLTAAFTPSNITAGLQSGAAAFGVVGGAYGIAELTKSAYTATRQMENLTLSFESVFKSSDEAAVHIDYVRQMTDKLGLSFVETSAGAKKLFASAQGTVLQDSASEIFEAFSTMSAALKLTGAETESVFLAISQMISKGKVSAEELRLQLSERMPGAVNLFAQAIGVTTKELDKMLQMGEVGLDDLVKFSQTVQMTYQQGAMNAANGLQAEMARVANSWFDLKRAFVDSDWSASALRFVNDLLEGLEYLSPALSAVVSMSLAMGTSLAGLFVLSRLSSMFITVGASAITASRNIATANNSFLAIQATSKNLIGSLNNVLSAFGGLKGVALAGVVTGLYYLITAQSEADQLFEQLSASSSSFDGNMKQLASSTSEATAALDKLRITQAETNKNLAISNLGVVLGEGIRDQINEALDIDFFGTRSTNKIANSAYALSDAFARSFKKGLETNMSPEDLQNIIDTYKVDFGNLEATMLSLGLPEQSIENIRDFSENMVQLAMNAANASDAFNEMNTKVQGIAEAMVGPQIDTKWIANFIQEYESGVTKVLESTKALDVSKEQSQKALNEQLSQQLAYILNNKEAYSEMGEVAKLQLGAVNDIVARLPEYLRENNIELDTFVTTMSNLGVSSTILDGIVAKFRELSNMDFSQGIEGLTRDLQEQLNTLGATSLETKLFSTFEREFGLDLSIAKNVQAIKDLDRATIESTIGAQIADEVWNGLVTTYTSLSKAIEASSKNKGSSNTLASDLEYEAGSAAKAIQELKEEAERSLLSAKQMYADFRSEQENAYRAMFIGSDRDQLARIEEDYSVMKERLDEFRMTAQLTGAEYDRMLAILQQNVNLESMQYVDEFLPQMTLALDEYYNEWDNRSRHTADIFTTGVKDMATAVGEFAASGLSDFESFSDAMESIAKNLVSNLANMFSNQIFSGIGELWSNEQKSGSSSGSSGWGGIISGIGDWIGGLLFSANGNAVSGGNISSFSNSIVSTPTPFSYGVKKFAMGAGLMGEAGAEAIMPLARTASGQLGVRTTGGTGGINQEIVINVHNNAGADVSTSQSTDSQGNARLDIMLDKQNAQALSRPGSATSKAMSNLYGAKPALANR